MPVVNSITSEDIQRPAAPSNIWADDATYLESAGPIGGMDQDKWTWAATSGHGRPLRPRPRTRLLKRRSSETGVDPFSTDPHRAARCSLEPRRRCD